MKHGHIKFANVLVGYRRNANKYVVWTYGTAPYPFRCLTYGELSTIKQYTGRYIDLDLLECMYERVELSWYESLLISLEPEEVDHGSA